MVREHGRTLKWCSPVERSTNRVELQPMKERFAFANGVNGVTKEGGVSLRAWRPPGAMLIKEEGGGLISEA